MAVDEPIYVMTCPGCGYHHDRNINFAATACRVCGYRDGVVFTRQELLLRRIAYTLDDIIDRMAK